MRKTFSLFAAAVLAFLAVQTSQAQTYGSYSLANVPNYNAGSSNVNTVIDCRANRYVGLTLSATAYTATNSTFTISLIRSPDNSKWESASWLTIPLTVTTNTSASLISSNIDVGSFGYVKLTTAAAGNNALTNCAVIVSQKPGQ